MIYKAKNILVIEIENNLQTSVKVDTNPPTWESTYHGLHVSIVDKFKDFIHSKVPMYGISMSWSPL